MVGNAATILKKSRPSYPPIGSIRKLFRTTVVNNIQPQKLLWEIVREIALQLQECIVLMMMMMIY